MVLFSNYRGEQVQQDRKIHPPQIQHNSTLIANSLSYSTHEATQQQFIFQRCHIRLYSQEFEHVQLVAIDVVHLDMVNCIFLPHQF